MRDGLVLVAAASPKLKVGNPAFNVKEQIALAKRANEEGVKVLAFPELSLTGYTCSDLFFQKKLLQEAENALVEYIKESENWGHISFVGLPVPFCNQLYICAAAVYGGKLLGLVPKTNVCNYQEFYEARQFAGAKEENFEIHFANETVTLGTKQIFSSKELPSLKIACEICEDAWVPMSPSSSHVLAGATIIVNQSASDEYIGKAEYRKNLISLQSAKTVSGYIYADAGEGESGTDLIYAAHNLIAENGRILNESELFLENSLTKAIIDLERIEASRIKTSTFVGNPSKDYIEVPFSMAIEETKLDRVEPRFPFVPSDEAGKAKRCELILNLQSHGLARRLERAHGKKLVLGVSGGLDSTLALLVCVRAMDILNRPRADILAVTMPCFGTTKRTKSNAEKLSQKIGATLKVVDIKRAVDQHFKDIGQEKETYDVTFENGQARERTQVLMDLANKENGLVVGTGDLSELALGWATYNGDHMSMYAVNASVPKTLVRHIVGYEAELYLEKGETVIANTLKDILATPVSPELLPAKDGKISQCTEDLVGPYELHDFFLYYFLRFGFTPRKIYRLARETFKGIYSDEVILKWLKTFIRRFFSQQFKRSCLPDGPKVGTICLSPRGDWRMPSDADASIWLEDLENL